MNLFLYTVDMPGSGEPISLHCQVVVNLFLTLPGGGERISVHCQVVNLFLYTAGWW